jgi:hypothetical protein
LTFSSLQEPLSSFQQDSGFFSCQFAIILLWRLKHPGGLAMSVIQFESVVEGNIIRIPEEYIGQIPAMVTVTLIDAEKPRFRPKTIGQLPAIQEFPPLLDTRGWKFNREEANERR